MTGRGNRRLARQARRYAARRGAPAWAVVLALAGFGLRALIPIGFEPAHGSLSLALCHEGFPAQFFSRERGAATHGGHAGTGVHNSHCAFCNGTSPAPAYSVTAIAGITPVAIGLVSFFQSSSQGARLAHIPRARAPPLAA